MSFFQSVFWLCNLFVIENKFFVFWPFPQIFGQIDAFANLIGCPSGFQFSSPLILFIDQVRTIFFLASNIPMGYFFRTIKSTRSRYLFAIFYGTFIRYFTCLEGSIIIDIQTFICFFLTKYFKKNAPKIILIESLLVLSLTHIQRLVVDYKGWKMDVSTILMIATCKYISFAFCYSDGFKDKTELFQDQNERKITKMPSYMEYCSYIYFFGSTIYGPTYDFNEYKNFIEKEGAFKSIPKGYFSCLKQFILFAIFATTLIVVEKFYPLEFLTSSEFANFSFIKKIYYTMIISYLLKCKFYGGWSLEQSQLISTGLAWGGYDENKQENWKGILAVDIMGEFELIFVQIYTFYRISPRIKMELWNYSVALWLKRYIYLRVANPQELRTNKTKSMCAQLSATFVMAIWHGFYPSYYLTFPLIAFYTTLGKQFYKLNLNKHPILFDYKIVQWIALFLSCFAQNFLGAIAELLEIGADLQFIQAIYYSVPIALVGGVLFFSITGYGQRAKKIETKKD